MQEKLDFWKILNQDVKIGPEFNLYTNTYQDPESDLVK